jgi:hypothetical protein
VFFAGQVIVTVAFPCHPETRRAEGLWVRTERPSGTTSDVIKKGSLLDKHVLPTAPLLAVRNGARSRRFPTD